MAESPVFRIVLQRHEADCCIAAISMALGVSYELTLMAAVDCPSVLTGGMRTKDMRRTAARLGYRLRQLRRYDIDDEDAFGILTVRYGPTDREHVVILRRGELVETDGNFWEPETYFAHHKATHGPLFVAEPMTAKGKHG